ncbi:T-box protein VegT-like [Bufo gargarizans]|uniref:T-box protein VegT-like n=1 Tax=Bufo gargarizans TaxID=30331 RepID=UPI001CF1ABFB|nr:T-box protein VegT-like [Bufo gargarizans]
MDCVTNQDSLYLPSSVSASLEDVDLWSQFHQEGTEMIITKSGRRMFPQCKIRLFGLHPYTKYVVLVDFVPLDNCRYKWNKNQWESAGKAEPHPPCRTYIHPDSPAPGTHWMKDVICFQKLKLTNNTLDQHGHIILHSMHRYKPRFHVIQADDVYNSRWGLLQVFSFPETEFTAVTAYQNEKITKLKIDHNPFAKGFREQERSHKRDDLLKNVPQSPSKRQKRKKWENSPEAEDEDHCKVACVKEEPCDVPPGVYSQWVPDHEGSQNLAPNSPDLTGSPSQEQQVPSSSSRFLYRSPSRRYLQPLSGSLDLCEAQGRRLTPDVATVPDPDAFQVPSLPSLRPAQDRSSVMNIPIDAPTRQSLRGPMYSPYGAEQWMVPTQGQYRPMSYSYPTEFSTQGAVGHPHNGMTDWSQYSLFPYTCW